jgi:hypothetical protein
MKSVQWLTDIEVVDHDYKGYYAKKGWTDDAVIKTTSRIDVPGHGSTLTGLHHKVAGLAFAGTRGISAIRCQCEQPTARALSSHPLNRMRHPKARPGYTKSR